MNISSKCFHFCRVVLSTHRFFLFKFCCVGCKELFFLLQYQKIKLIIKYSWLIFKIFVICLCTILLQHCFLMAWYVNILLGHNESSYIIWHNCPWMRFSIMFLEFEGTFLNQFKLEVLSVINKKDTYWKISISYKFR